MQSLAQYLRLLLLGVPLQATDGRLILQLHLRAPAVTQRIDAARPTGGWPRLNREWLGFVYFSWLQEFLSMCKYRVFRRHSVLFGGG